MQLLIRLYEPYDLDLIYLRKCGKSGFQEMIRKALRSHLGGEGFEIEFETDGQLNPEDIKTHIISLTINENRDPILCDFIRSIRMFARGDLIKMITRSCYNSFPSFLYSKEFLLSGGKKLPENYGIQKKEKVVVSKKKEPVPKEEHHEEMPPGETEPVLKKEEPVIPQPDEPESGGQADDAISILQGMADF